MDIQLLDIYDVVLGDGDGIAGISLVDAPAISQRWLMQRAQAQAQAQAPVRRPIALHEDGDAHLLISPILIPQQLIYRRDGSYEYFIRWSRKAIEAAALRMSASLSYNRFSLNHEWFCGGSPEPYEETLASGIVCERLWVTENTADPLYTAYGFKPEKCPVGTLCIAARVNDDDLWMRCKAGEFQGFSIEGFVSYEKSK